MFGQTEDSARAKRGKGYLAASKMKTEVVQVEETKKQEPLCTWHQQPQSPAPSWRNWAG